MYGKKGGVEEVNHRQARYKVRTEHVLLISKKGLGFKMKQKACRQLMYIMLIPPGIVAVSRLKTLFSPLGPCP